MFAAVYENMQRVRCLFAYLSAVIYKGMIQNTAENVEISFWHSGVGCCVVGPGEGVLFCLGGGGVSGELAGTWKFELRVVLLSFFFLSCVFFYRGRVVRCCTLLLYHSENMHM